jgi:hypothetical protein
MSRGSSKSQPLSRVRQPSQGISRRRGNRLWRSVRHNRLLGPRTTGGQPSSLCSARSDPLAGVSSLLYSSRQRSGPLTLSARYSGSTQYRRVRGSSGRGLSQSIDRTSGYAAAASCAGPSGLLAIYMAAILIMLGSVAPAYAVASARPSASPATGSHTSDKVPLFAGISCPSPSTCVAISGASVTTSSDPFGGASAWTSRQADTAPVACGSQPNCQASLTAISCPSQSLCVAGDDGGNVVTSTDPLGPTGAWTVTHIDSGPMACSHFCFDEVLGVSCPSASLCVAVDNGGRAYVTTNPTGGAAAWSSAALESQPPIGELTGNVSCATEALCVAVVEGDVFTSTTPTEGASAWSDATVDPPLFIDSRPPGELGSVSCTSPALCVAAETDRDFGAGGYVVTSRNPTGGASAWTVKFVDPGRLAQCDPEACQASFHAISCPSISLCVGVDDAGNVVSSVNPAGPPGAWTVKHVDPNVPSSFTQGISGVSCASNAFCAAVDVAGNILTTRDPTGGATSWRTVSLAVPSIMQLRSLLTKWLAPARHTPRIKSLLRRHRFAVVFNFPIPGRLEIDWYYVPKGARLAVSTARAKPTRVATGSVAFSTAGPRRVTIKLTRAGVRILKRAKRLKLTAKGTYIPTGRGAIITTKTFRLTE